MLIFSYYSSCDLLVREKFTTKKGKPYYVVEQNEQLRPWPPAPSSEHLCNLTLELKP